MSEEATFGFWLKDRRKVLDLTQDELARRVGCSLTLIRKIEADERRPSKQIAELLGIHLGIPADERADFVRFVRARDARFAPTQKFPWRTLRQHLTNLPIPPTPLFGREQEIADIVRRIARDHARLLTLVGPPGIGKTRLALACADQLLDHFDDGVYFIPLAPLRDSELVLATIARALAVKAIPGQPPLAGLTQYLIDKRVLLVLDNFEQVVAAAPLVAELLTRCPWLHLLVTSRVSLHVRAEKQIRVALLGLPPLDFNNSPEQLLEYPAVQFFIDRARAVESNFPLSSDNIRAIVQICARLDGLPLAIELVATRVGTVPVPELLTQVERRLAVTTEGPQDLPRRHQSLRQAIDGSYDLLDASEQKLFARLSIFVGGCATLAVEQVCGAADKLPRLVDQSLVRIEAQRYSMLETIREYALERLEQSGIANEMRTRHANYFLELAESAESELTGAQQMVWLDRLEQEHHNLRAALTWTIETRHTEMALRMSGALWRFWQTRGYLTEGLKWLQAALDLISVDRDPAIASARAKALLGMGWLLRDLGDFAEMKNRFEECLILCKQLDDPSQLAYALYSVGYAHFMIGDEARGIQTIEESVTLYRTLPDHHGMALPLFMLGRIAIGTGDYERAHKCLIESLRIERKQGATFGTARTLASLGELAIYRGEYAKATEYLAESETILNQLSERQLFAWVLTKQGELTWRQGDWAHARQFLEESLDLSREIGYRWNGAYTLTYLGLVTLNEGDIEGAQKLCEESLAQFQELGSEADIAQTQKDLARVLLHRGDYARALELYTQSLSVLSKRHYLPDVAECLEGLAATRGLRGDAVGALRLFGAAEALRERIGAPLPPVLVTSHQRNLTALHLQLDEQTYHQTWAEGRTLPLEQAVDLACHSDSPS